MHGNHVIPVSPKPFKSDFKPKAMKANCNLYVRGIVVLSIFSVFTFLVCLISENFAQRSIKEIISTATFRHSHSSQAAEINTQQWDLDIVVAHFKEDLKGLAKTLEKVQNVTSVRGLRRRIFLYTKNKENNDKRKLRKIARDLNITQAIYLPNEGREGGTYLHHIIQNYDNLSPHTLFLQANPHSPTSMLKTLQNYFYEDTGVLALGPYGTCECNNCRDIWSDVTWRRIGEMYTMTHESFCPKDILISISAQMIAHRDHIRSTKLKAWKTIYDKLRYGIGMDPKPKWMVTEDITNPFLGHALERSWMVLFDCIKPELAKNCKPNEWPKAEPDAAKRKSLRDSCQCIHRKGAEDDNDKVKKSWIPRGNRYP
ncbi:hypothetical protein TWF694_001408 [Orbilia ellipsospora]|uniref:Uncharacterized protein n=1 Tax=Orbilia ellipsospora TaxID=2528407 RepID=A0AAV9XT44_9PEZI